MNNIRTVLILLVLLILDKTMVAQNAPIGKLSLQKCIETGIANNLTVQQRGLALERSKIDWNQSRLNLFPSVNANVSYGTSQGRNVDPATNTYYNSKITSGDFGVGSDVILFNGLTLQNAIKRDALAYEASKMDWQQSKDNLTIGIILAYLQVLSNEDQLAQSRNQLAVSKDAVDRLVKLNDQGAIAPSLLSDLRGQYASDQLSIINTQNSLETAKINLCQLMNIHYDKNMQLERISAESFATLYDQTPDSIYQVALQDFALIKAVDLRRQSAARGVKVVRGQLYPTLSLGGNIGTAYSTTFQTPTGQKIPFREQFNNNRWSSYGLNLRIPIFNSLQTRNRVKVAKLDLKNSELVEQFSKTDLQRSIEQAYANMTSASESYKTLLEQVTAYKESFRAAEIRFNAGLGTSVDYLTAKNNMDRANINLITEKYNYILRTKILDYYQGKQLW